MRVSSLFKYVLVLALIVLVVPKVKAETRDQHIKVVLRTIGHEFLLQLNDSTSRVLPIEKIEGRYAVKFERTFSFEPDALFFSAVKTFEESQITDAYIIEVEACNKNEVLHSFAANFETDINTIACKSRLMPKDCYVFYFTLMDGSMGIAQKGFATRSLWRYVWIAIVLIILAIIFFVFKSRRGKQSNLDLISLGKYQFDQKGMRLILKEQKIELSSKETELLYLLCSNENKTLEKEYILKVVWGDEGNYVGRTLDVFISKLRKKLEADDRLKIVNVRGVGYRFVIS